ncbi:MAG: 6-carboxytetrahydropterin synthase QueD [Elusimicrobia bacterium]|nr:6-carboxytetrahydropterin synthase QueD [Elusimicrobiota bacterium]MDE2237351.1 6-carboxytetrahydropterin synthase QueD [Elusimicrobiota bacterium]MDE2424516.1 6-carboxytetrahydropterin synthase QueD [Elusimicrobiota bacterium]
MYRVTRVIHFCYGHRLLDYEGKCRHPHGHNGKIEISMSGRRLDRRGMVMDFEEIKRAVQRWVDEELDHKMLLDKRDPLAALLRDLGEPVVAMEANPTAENIARLIFEHARESGLPVASVRLWETANSFAEYAGE